MAAASPDFGFALKKPRTREDQQKFTFHGLAYPKEIFQQCNLCIYNMSQNKCTFPFVFLK